MECVMVQLLEEAIRKVKRLPPEKQEEIAEIILAEMKEADWDRQIEEDLKAGRLDELIQEAEEDIAGGRTHSL
jgi:hypothetical protein